MRRKFTAELFDLFDIVVCAESYGFSNSILLDALHSWAGKVTMAEINAYGRALAETDGYSEEDGDSAVETLKAWHKQFA